jgi:hypothetical protein
MNQEVDPKQPVSPEEEIMDQQCRLTPIPMGVERRVMQVCAGSPIPNGWIKVDDDWSATSCGNPSSITYNVWTIETYGDKPLNAIMEVCSGAPTPSGWVEEDRYWSPTRCGHPHSVTHNIKRIRRVS